MAVTTSFVRSLRGTLIILFLLIALIPIIIIGPLTTYWIELHLYQEAENKLIAIRTIKATQIEQYMRERLQDVDNFSSNPSTIAAMQAFTQSFNDADVEELRYLYVRQPNLTNANDGSAYSQVHAKHHALLRKYQQDYGYYDIFLIEPKFGNIVYSVFKEDDFATSLKHGKYAETNLAYAFGRANSVSDPNFTILVDFAHYSSSNYAAAAFVASPIFADSKLVGILAFQLSIDQINNLMQESSGMGATGETVLVSGEDFLLRSDSRFSSQSSLLRTKLHNPASIAAANGSSGVQILHDPQASLVAYTALQLPNVNWLLLAKVDEYQVRAMARNLEQTLIIFILICSLIIIWLAMFLSKKISAPIVEMTNIVTQLAAGKFTQRTINLTTNNELKIMAVAFDQMTSHLQQVIANSNQFLHQLAQGTTDTKINGEFLGDFAKLKLALENTAIKLAQVAQLNQTQDWIKNGHAQLNERLRGDQNIELLAKNTIDFLANYLQLQVAVLYLLEKDDKPYLQLAANYGYVPINIKTRFYAAEGLIGQILINPKTILRRLEPEEYTSFTQSSLAQAVPKYVLLIPFFYEEHLKGVIELGSGRNFNTIDQEFLQQAMPSIGIAINTAESRRKMQVLLEQSQQQAEQLKRQQLEMQQTNEELQSQQEELQSQQEELRQTNEELEQRSQIMQQQQAEVKQKNLELETAKAAMQIKAEELELASKYKSEFLANMSLGVTQL